MTSRRCRHKAKQESCCPNPTIEHLFFLVPPSSTCHHGVLTGPPRCSRDLVPVLTVLAEHGADTIESEGPCPTVGRWVSYPTAARCALNYMLNEEAHFLRGLGLRSHRWVRVSIAQLETLRCCDQNDHGTTADGCDSHLRTCQAVSDTNNRSRCHMYSECVCTHACIRSVHEHVWAMTCAFTSTHKGIGV